MSKKFKQPQIIFFNNNDMKCYTLVNLIIEDNGFTKDNIYNQKSSIQAFIRIQEGEIGDKIELDDLTMRKIARYNIEKDIEILIRKKKIIEQELKQLQYKLKLKKIKT